MNRDIILILILLIIILIVVRLQKTSVRVSPQSKQDKKKKIKFNSINRDSRPRVVIYENTEDSFYSLPSDEPKQQDSLPSDEPVNCPDPVVCDTCPDPQITICHHPSVNSDPNSWQTLSVPTSTISTHYSHGDTLGPCPA